MRGRCFPVVKLVVPPVGTINPDAAVCDLARRRNIAWALALRALLTLLPNDFSGLAQKSFGNNYWAEKMDDAELIRVLS